MAINSEVSESGKYKVTLDTESGSIEVKNLIESTWIKGVIPEVNISVIFAMVVPGFSDGAILYAIGYYIASKVSGGSSAK